MRKNTARPVINLKMLNQFVPFLHFKMEGLAQLKHLIQEGDWMCKPGPEKYMLQYPFGSKLEEVRKVSVEGELVERVHLSVFWTRSSTMSVYKVIHSLEKTTSE